MWVAFSWAQVLRTGGVQVQGSGGVGILRITGNLGRQLLAKSDCGGRLDLWILGIRFPEVQVGGSSSSTDPCVPVAVNGQVGGSSSSHGWAVQQASWGACYEDLFEPVEDLTEFPVVGTWIRMHYLICLLSKEGERILWFLGVRSREWSFLRTASGMFRHALATAVAEVLQRGPYAVMFLGPQWMMAVEEYLSSGYPVDDEVHQEGVGAGRLGSVFPYVNWGPSVATHLLWKIFELEGSLVLAYIGSRVRDWNCLMSVAMGFRSSSLYAFIGWLRDTAAPQVIETPVAIDVAEAYLQAEVEEVLPQDREDDPSLDDRRPFTRTPEVHQIQWPPFARVLEQSSSDSEDLGSSTTHPNGVSSSGESSGNRTDVLDVGEESSGVFGPVYEAFEGSMAVTYVDDRTVIELPGWSLADVEDLIRRLETGDGVEMQGCLLGRQVRQGPNVRAPAGYAWSPWRPQRMQMLLGLIILWVMCVFLRVAVAEGEKVGRSSEGQCAVVPIGRELQVAPETLDVDIPEDEGEMGCDGSYLWEGFKTVLLILTWEIARSLCPCRRRAARMSSAESQTDAGATISMPLGDDVHCRGRILFCLWQAGFNLDIGPYPERIRSEFHGLVGDYLQRVEGGEVSDWDSD